MIRRVELSILKPSSVASHTILHESRSQGGGAMAFNRVALPVPAVALALGTGELVASRQEHAAGMGVFFLGRLRPWSRLPPDWPIRERWARV
jgi:hypothetical protein